MKKTYEAPSVEKIAFQYRDQVVVASSPSGSCTYHWDANEEAGLNSGCQIHWESAHA